MNAGASGLPRGSIIVPAFSRGAFWTRRATRSSFWRTPTATALADKATTFYQGPEINAALGICVLGNKVIVSCSPNVYVFTDTNGDGKADTKEILFSGISGVDHDHGVHAMSFGPDGKLYFNFGNAGGQIKDKDGKPIIDLAGNEVNNRGRPYRQGMVFRCNLDGSDVEVLAYNFRNPYEVAVDSFGTLWQSDNDDDGNRERARSIT